MDTSDPEIVFDAYGICNRCKGFEIERTKHVPAPAERERLLHDLVRHIKEEGKDSDYDCVIGVSGGVDSTYTAYLVKQLGLRPLAIHMDNGWDSEVAVSNIEKALKLLSIDLYTHVLDWDEFRDLQLAFLKSSTADSEIPTDHAILAVVLKKAAQIGTRYIIWGVNTATEGMAVPIGGTGHYDWKYIQSVHNMYGTVPLKKYPHLALWDYVHLRYFIRQKQVYILNYVDYKKEEAISALTKELDWKPYAGKHHESIYTRFFQSYILPHKFGYDKRRMHLSTLVISGQLSRQQALIEMENEINPPEMLKQDKVFVAKKLGLTVEEFDNLLSLPNKSFWDYPSYEKSWLMKFYRKCRF